MLADLVAKIDAWCDAPAGDSDNGDNLKKFLVNFAKAVIALLDYFGEWPIEVK